MALDATQRLHAIRTHAELVEAGCTPSEAARRVGASAASLDRWRKAYKEGGLAALAPRKSPGRPARAAELTDEQIAFVRQVAAKEGSARLAFDRLAFAPGCSDELRDYLLATRDLPPSLMRLCHITAAAKALHQGPRHLQLAGPVNLRDMTELMPDNTRREILAGDWWEMDDMSLNQPFWFDCDPEDFQGDPMAQRYRRSLGRQSLWAVDVRSGKVLGFELIGRRRDAYRAEDILRFLRRLFADHGLPRRGLRLERGTWKSSRIKGIKVDAKNGPALDPEQASLMAALGEDYERPEMAEEEKQVVIGGLAKLGLEVVHAWSPKQKGIIEGSFNNLQRIINSFAGHA